MVATTLFFFGPDTYRSGQKLAALRQRYVDAALGDTNVVVFDGDKLTLPEFARQVQALPFLASSRLVIVKNLLLASTKDLQEGVRSYLEKIPTSTIVVFYEAGQPDRRLKLFTVLNQPKRAESFPLLEGRELDRWIEEAAVERGLTLPVALRRQLAAIVGSDLWRMSNELDKLVSFSAISGLTETDLDRLLSHDKTSDVFRLIEALARRQGKRALEEFHTLLVTGEAELYLFSMIVYQFRTLLLVAELVAAGQRSAQVVARTLKLPPFVAERTLAIVRPLSLEFLIGCYQRLLDYDVRMKTGELEPRLALELLIGEFCTRTSSQEIQSAVR